MTGKIGKTGRTPRRQRSRSPTRWRSETMSEERLQKILARAGVASRRKVEDLIREARVTINGKVAEIGDKADAEHDAIKLDGKRVLPKTGAHRSLLLNKPRGVMSTVKDPEGRPTVLDLVPPAMRKAV